MKKTLVTTFLALATSSLLCFAQEAPIRPDIDELLTVMRVEENMKAGMENMKRMMPQITANAMKQANVSGSETASQIQIKVMDMVQQEMSWKKMKPEVAKIYAESFTPAETKDVIAFYKSPAGKNFLDKQPEIMAKMMAVTQKMAMGLMPKIQAVVQDEIQAEKAKPSPAPAK